MNSKQWVLVMENEAVRRTETRRMLEQSGYGVYLAGSGDDAAACYTVARECGYPFAAVIMGAGVAGGACSAEAIKRLFKVDPDVKVIALGNDQKETVDDHLREQGVREILVRPFTGEELDRVLRTTLKNAREAE